MVLELMENFLTETILRYVFLELIENFPTKTILR